MACELDLVESQPALGAPDADVARGGECAAVVFGVVGDEEFVLAREGLEALLAAPGHVLEGEDGAVGGEEEVEVADADEGVVDGVDDVGEHAVLRGAEGGVGEVGVVARAAEDVGAGALHPVCADGGVDGFLHVGAVEVDDFAGGVVVARVHDAEL